MFSIRIEIHMYWRQHFLLNAEVDSVGVIEKWNKSVGIELLLKLLHINECSKFGY